MALFRSSVGTVETILRQSKLNRQHRLGHVYAQHVVLSISTLLVNLSSALIVDLLSQVVKRETTPGEVLAVLLADFALAT